MTGTETEDTILTHEANQKAVEALQYLLRKLPNKLSFKDNLNALPITDDDNNLSDIRPISQLKQYNIPNDPNIPEFKPLKNAITSTYTWSLGPYESSTKHTVQELNDDSIGTISTVSNLNNKFIVRQPQPTHTNFTLHRNLTPPKPASYRHQLHKNYPSYQSHSYTINAQPLDLYHTMSLKNDPVKINSLPQHEIEIHLPPASKPHFQIQKSIEYQLH